VHQGLAQAKQISLNFLCVFSILSGLISAHLQQTRDRGEIFPQTQYLRAPCVALKALAHSFVAGVPVKKAVAGVAMGLILEPDGHFQILTDILGSEDAMGDMDFKVAGDADHITAFQMDIKVGHPAHSRLLGMGLVNELIGRSWLQWSNDKKICPAFAVLSHVATHRVCSMKRPCCASLGGHCLPVVLIAGNHCRRY
jgi:hypothetical protein